MVIRGGAESTRSGRPCRKFLSHNGSVGRPAVAPSFGCAALVTVDNAPAAKRAGRRLGGRKGVRPTAAIRRQRQADGLPGVANERTDGDSPSLA